MNVEVRGRCLCCLVRRSAELRLPSSELVRPEGLEPPTLGSEGGQSTLEIDSDQGGQMDMFSL